MTKQQWLKNFLLLSVFIIIMVGVFNYIVDPYGLYRVIEIKGFNQQKEGVRTNIRYVKALEIALKKPKTIIMGSSRVHDGINPESIKSHNYQPVYNYGIDMARIKEIKYYLQHAIMNSKIEHLILGLDFFMFNKYERLNHTYDSEIVKKHISTFDIYFKPLFTISSLSSSIKTIKTSMNQPNRREFLSNGYRPGYHVFYGLKSYEKLHQSTNWIFLSSKLSNTLYYAKMEIDEEALNDFKEILEICKKNNINCKLYFSPGHSNLDGEGLLAAGLYNEFEKWKKEISLISYQYNISLHDFSGYNTITTESVQTPMRYYWDSSHFTELVGNMIIDNIFNIKKSTQDTFGAKITPKNIYNHLQNIRINQDLYHKNNIESLKELHDTYSKALNGNKQDTEIIKGIF
jgi:hypothetical protein